MNLKQLYQNPFPHWENIDENCSDIVAEYFMDYMDAILEDMVTLQALLDSRAGFSLDYPNLVVNVTQDYQYLLNEKINKIFVPISHILIAPMPKGIQ